MQMLQRWSKSTIFRGQDRDQIQEKIPRPRTEFPRTSTLEVRLKPERSRRQILQLLAGVWYIFKNLGTGLELECSLSTFTVQISIFAQFFHLLQLICFVLKSVGVECCPKV